MRLRATRTHDTRATTGARARAQMRAEITMAASAIPFMALFQVPVSLAEIHGCELLGVRAA